MVDTGSFATVIPQRLWKGHDMTLLPATDVIRLFRSGRLVRVRIARMPIRLEDRAGSFVEIEPRVYLADTDDVPFVIGFLDVLDRARLVCHYRARIGTLEFPE